VSLSRVSESVHLYLSFWCVQCFELPDDELVLEFCVRVLRVSGYLFFGVSTDRQSTLEEASDPRSVFFRHAMEWTSLGYNNTL